MKKIICFIIVFICIISNNSYATDDELKNRLFILYKVLNKAHEDISNALRDFQN